MKKTTKYFSGKQKVINSKTSKYEMNYKQRLALVLRDKQLLEICRRLEDK